MNKGGIMTPDEAKIFENDPLFADSLLIRKYDELAKIENMKINVSFERLLRRVFHIDASQLAFLANYVITS